MLGALYPLRRKNEGKNVGNQLELSDGESDGKGGRPHEIQDRQNEVPAK